LLYLHISYYRQLQLPWEPKFYAERPCTFKHAQHTYTSSNGHKYTCCVLLSYAQIPGPSNWAQKILKCSYLKPLSCNSCSSDLHTGTRHSLTISCDDLKMHQFWTKGWKLIQAYAVHHIWKAVTLLWHVRWHASGLQELGERNGAFWEF